MTLANIDPMKRVAVVLFHVESAFKEAQAAAAAGDRDKLYSKLGLAFELLNPLVGSLTILEESQKRSLVEKLLGTQN
jgi:hypothetical protein